MGNNFVCWKSANKIHRGYYMAARRYEISLRVLKNISLVRCAHSWNIFSTREEKFRISARPCNVLFIIQTPMKYQIISFLVFWCERQHLLYSPSNSDIFTCEDNSSMNGTLITQYMLKRKRNLRITQEYFQPQIGRKIRIFSMSSMGRKKKNGLIEKKECKLGMCSSHFVSDPQRMTDWF